jgi:hypothetical protein
MNWEEKRKHIRTDAIWDVMENEKYFGILVDISPSGASIWTANENKKNLNEDFLLHIKCPSKLNYKDIRLPAVIRWIKEDEDEMIFLGAEFKSFAGNNQDDLNELIKYFKF